jgi:predicted DNA-binding protein YlxM (UPF0122 family)
MTKIVYKRLKLSDVQVVRDRYMVGDVTIPELAAEYGVQRNVIYKVVHGQLTKQLEIVARAKAMIEEEEAKIAKEKAKLNEQ